MITVITHNPEETIQFGEDFAAKLSPGDVVALCGELGAGKTVLAKGICRGLGYEGEVTSPSFVRIHTYPHSIPIYHVDFYLLRSAEEVADLGLDELYDGNNIIIIEWAQRFPDLVPEESWWVEIEWQCGEETIRRIKIDHRSSS